MDRLCKTVLAIAVVLCLTGCSNPEHNSKPSSIEYPHMYWKDIDVVVTGADHKHGYRCLISEITVKSDEYGLEESFRDVGGTFKAPIGWNYEEGDVVKAEMTSWVIDSTGEVTRRELSRLY